MSTGKDLSYGPRQKWFAEAYGVPWVYANHDGRSRRAFYQAMLGDGVSKGFNREGGSFKPDLYELVAWAKLMGYPEEQQQEVGSWIHTGIGAPPPPPPGITAKPIPLPKEAIPLGSAANPIKLPKNVARPFPVASVADPKELERARELATDLVMEAGEKGETLPPKLRELLGLIRSMASSAKKPLAALLVGATLALAAPEATAACDATHTGLRIGPPDESKEKRSKKTKRPRLEPAKAALAERLGSRSDDRARRPFVRQLQPRAAPKNLNHKKPA